MMHWSEWAGDETPRSHDLTLYDHNNNNDNSNTIGDVEYDAHRVDVSKEALEEQMSTGIYIVDGLITMLFFPLRLPKLLGVDKRKAKSFFFPLGHKLTCVPFMSLMMWLCAFGIGAQLYRSTYDVRDLRTLTNVPYIVSIGDAIVAVTMFGGVASVVAAAVSHHPRFVRWSQETTTIFESIPFSLGPANPTFVRFNETQDYNDLHELTALDDLQAVPGPASAPGPGANLLGASANEQRGNPLPSVFLDGNGSLIAKSNGPTGGVREMLDGNFSPPPEPLAATVRLNDHHLYDNPNSYIRTMQIPAMPRRGISEFQTLDDPIPRRYIPFTHILMDEVPPLKDETMHFVYDGAEWFEPQRQNRLQLDRSLALFRDVWTTQQKQELDAQLERRRQRLAAPPTAPPSARDAMTEAEEIDDDADLAAAHFAVINADSAEWKPSDLFKFTLGDRILRNNDLLHLQVSFDGETSVQPGETFVVSNRMWHENCALYCIEGASDTHQWQAIEALFECVEETGRVRKIDKAITSENMLLAMSGRDILRRTDSYNNGNMSASETVIFVEPWVVAAYGVCATLLSLVPTIIRALQGGGLYAEPTLPNVALVIGSIVLFAMCTTSIMVFLTTTRRSVANYDDNVDSFTEVTMGSSSNKWYPVLNWFETINIRTWFHLRQHILTTYEVHYNSRLAACFTILLLASSWSWFVVVYAFTYPDRQRPTADGWILQVCIVCIPILVELLRIFDHAASVNEFCLSHTAILAQIQVALDEELMLVGARTVNKNPALQQALLTTMTQASVSQSTGSSAAAAAAKIQGLSNVTIANRSNDFQFLLDSKLLLDDVHFAVQHHLAPLRPFGLTVNRHLVQYIMITLIINVVGTSMVLAGFALNSERWHV
jgi:hypothetical protein